MDKKVFLKSSIMVVLFAFALTSCDKEAIIPSNDLPNEITTYISTHFSNKSIIQVTKDKDGLIKTYDILLSDNLSLEFNRKNEIIDIDGVDQLPNSVTPAKLLEYVKANFSANYITGWELDGRNQQIQLNSGIDLEFNMMGDFLRIDN